VYYNAIYEQHPIKLCIQVTDIKFLKQTSSNFTR
jgi:hypothetical protein